MAVEHSANAELETEIDDFRKANELLHALIANREAEIVALKQECESLRAALAAAQAGGVDKDRVAEVEKERVTLRIGHSMGFAAGIEEAEDAVQTCPSLDEDGHVCRKSDAILAIRALRAPAAPTEGDRRPATRADFEEIYGSNPPPLSASAPAGAPSDIIPIAWRIAAACYEMVAGIRKQEGAEADVHFEGWLAHEIDQALKAAPAAPPTEEAVRSVITEALCAWRGQVTSESVEEAITRAVMGLVNCELSGGCPFGPDRER